MRKEIDKIMASSYFRRLEKKYGKTKITGKKYQSLISEILGHNNHKIGNAIGRLSNEHYQNSVSKLKKTTQKTIKLPDLSEVLPKRSVFMIKGAEKGKFVSETLRTRLEKDLRDTLKQFDQSGKTRIEIQRGKTTGKLNPELIKLFQKNIKTTFENYTKRDPKIGIPTNIRNIAVTEIRSTMGSIREGYKNQLLKKNPGFRAVKTWIHNRKLSKIPRISHMELNGKTIPDDQRFEVGRDDGSGIDYMVRPHDPSAPPGQNIGCSCEAIYKIQIG